MNFTLNTRRVHCTAPISQRGASESQLLKSMEVSCCHHPRQFMTPGIADSSTLEVTVCNQQNHTDSFPYSHLRCSWHQSPVSGPQSDKTATDWCSQPNLWLLLATQDQQLTLMRKTCLCIMPGCATCCPQLGSGFRQCVHKHL